MNTKHNGILFITPFFRPSYGGAETYLNDLCKYLSPYYTSIYVLTFQPLYEGDIKGLAKEIDGNY